MRLPPVRFLPSSAAPAVVDANARIARLARTGNMEGARAAFEAMPLRTTASYNALLAGYFRNNLPDAALRVFHRMPSRDLASYNALISGLSLRRHTLPDAAAALATIPYPPSVVSFTSLLRGYVRHGLLADAIQLFRQMPERNHISYTVLLGGFLDAGRIDALVALDVAERCKPIAIDRGALEIHVFGGFRHLPGDDGLHVLALARKKVRGFLDELGIALVADFMGAGAGTAFDLIKKTGTRAALEHAVCAGAQQERTL